VSKLLAYVALLTAFEASVAKSRREVYSAIGCFQCWVSHSRSRVMISGRRSTADDGRRKRIMRNEMRWGAAGVMIILLLFLMYYALFVYHTDPGYEDNSYHDYSAAVTLINNGEYDRALHVLEDSIMKSERHYVAIGRPADSQCDWQLARNLKLYGDLLVKRRDHRLGVACYRRAKENYEKLRARWPANAEISSELADTVTSLQNAAGTTTVH
jgi:tetratricopeptide (TPR) repeat protein